jgi:hypothetical protein
MMGEEFYCILKLVSGEEVFSLVCIDKTDEESVVIMQNPVVLKYVSKSNGSLLKIEPWIKFASDDFFIMHMEKIITMTEIKDEYMIRFYNEYLEESSGNKGKFPTPSPTDPVKVSEKMGYIASVDDARKMLENIYNNVQDT